MNNIIVIFGKPGAGKGTRIGEIMKKQSEEFVHIAMSDLIKEKIKNGGELGKKIKTYIDSGELVPDEIINDIIFKSLKSTREHEMTVLLDGYPRTVSQAATLLEEGFCPSKIIDLFVTDEVVIERAKNRLVCSACRETYTKSAYKPPKVEGICDICNGKLIRRSDDEESVVVNRLQVYSLQTDPVIEFMIDAGVKIETINNMKPTAKILFERAVNE